MNLKIFSFKPSKKKGKTSEHGNTTARLLSLKEVQEGLVLISKGHCFFGSDWSCTFYGILKVLLFCCDDGFAQIFAFFWGKLYNPKLSSCKILEILGLLPHLIHSIKNSYPSPESLGEWLTIPNLD